MANLKGLESTTDYFKVQF